MEEVLRLDQLAEALREAGIRQAFTPDVSRLTIRLWREIARGGPVSPGRVEQIASALDLPQQTAREVLHKMCERDRDGNVVGIAGLSQNQHPHRFTVNGIRLSTWCAWDSLFLTVTSFLACPCHLIVTLPLLASLLAGTALGSFLASNTGLVYTGASIYFVVALALGYWFLFGKSRPSSTMERTCPTCVPLEPGATARERSTTSDVVSATKSRE